MLGVISIVIRIRYGYVILFLFFITSLIILSCSLIKSHSSKSALEQEDTLYLPIIMYHQVKYSNLGKDVISPNEFESDLKYLKENDYNTITMTQLIDYVYKDKDLPENPIILSFDDGYLNTYKYAFPLIKKYDMKMVFSIIGVDIANFTHTQNKNLNYSHITWNQLNEMVDSGNVELQNHSYNLHYCKNRYGRVGSMQKSNESFERYEYVLSNDLNKLQDEIKMMTGVKPNTFTYPYGMANENTVIIIKELGFKASLSCKYGINRVTKDPKCLYGMKRICRSHGTSMNKLIRNAMKTVH